MAFACGKFTTMKMITFKMWEATLVNLRMIYALSGEPMVRILDRIIKDELEKLKKANAIQR